MEKHIRLKALRSVLVVALIVAGTGTAGEVAEREVPRPAPGPTKAPTRPRSPGSSARKLSTVC